MRKYCPVAFIYPASLDLGCSTIPGMADSITIPLDPQTAQAYDAATQEEKRKLQALLGLYLRDLTTRDLPSLQQILDRVGAKARDRGLTPEILDNLLKGA